MAEAAEAVVQQLQEMKNEANQLGMKINELDQERHEHSLVVETLSKMEGERKCYRRDISVSLSCLFSFFLGCKGEHGQGKFFTFHLSRLILYVQLQALCDDLYARLQKKEKEMQEFQAKHNIRLRDQPEKAAPK
ncbi:Prefoldin protein, subunit 2 [Guillardia theta CCMP2712]|uniref:Prefoldin protein, subunit 2 n=1 Tax=Guillardia theta (strain CCMP2712) TaxID=905079 RepID=L1IID6_GUITC|nr:Prefoldin protein, subunit 2 [Guillardia theta CCMP2712]EKX35842.1 Prefoldin protein, subunit 2 [Guillardia theta CCMP2712]|eukprot:XP_005822822.1 Prefoldin protein, subunit 2 [Guillardia theta CCMP2712]